MQGVRAMQDFDLDNDLRLLSRHLDGLPQIAGLATDLDTLLQVLLLQNPTTCAHE